MEKNLKNQQNKKRILILAASSDIGVEVVKKYLDSGWEILAHYNKNKKKLASIKNKNLRLFKLNLSNPVNVENFLKKKNKFLKGLDSFISLTGFLKLSTYENFSINDFYLHLNINYLANQLFIRKIIKNMKQKKWGRILTSSSIGTKFGGNKNTYLYSLSKHMNEFFPTIFKDISKFNILTNCIQVGVTKTKIHKKDKKKILGKRSKLIPIKRPAKPEEMANYIYFIASEKNTYMTLQKINIAGGE
jgi:3-oxoacyl-[acyl-carrier protein] reductase